MALLQTFKSYRKWVLEGENFQLASVRTSAKDIIFNDNDNLENKLGGLSFVVLSQSDYDALETKDESTIYLTK